MALNPGLPAFPGGGASGRVAGLRSQPRRTRLALGCSGIVKCSLQAETWKPGAKRARQHQKLSGDNLVCLGCRPRPPASVPPYPLVLMGKKESMGSAEQGRHGHCQRAVPGHRHVRCWPLRRLLRTTPFYSGDFPNEVPSRLKQ